MRNRNSGDAVKLDYSFWDHPENWPHDRPSHVFLARAVDQVGRTMFGDHWNTLEITDPEPDLPDDDAIEAIWDQHEVESDRYDEAYEKAEGAREERRTKIYRMIAEQSELDYLKTFSLQQNGRMSQIKSYYWNADDFQDLFRKCKISISGERRWIFVERASLEGFLITQPHIGPTTNASPHYYSPYLRVMMSVSKKMKVTPERQPKKSEIEAEIKSEWRGPKALSQKLTSAMATLIREPESQAGRAKGVPERSVE
jgi:hypothetical protein